MNRSGGFTWIELVMVLAVVGVLALMAIPLMFTAAGSLTTVVMGFSVPSGLNAVNQLTPVLWSMSSIRSGPQVGHGSPSKAVTALPPLSAAQSWRITQLTTLVREAIEIVRICGS